MPLVPQSFSQIIDFTRTSAATYVANTGFVTQTPASRNLLTFTQEFDNAAWSKSNATVTANSIIAPDGTVSADTLTLNTTSYPSVFATYTTTTSTTYTASIYAKAGTASVLGLEFRGSSSSPDATFNLNNGTVITGSGQITPVGNGWYRCSITKAAVDTSEILIVSAGIAPVAGQTIYIWGAQLEAVPDANLVLGSELVTNGSFSGGSTGWIVSGTDATHTITFSGGTARYQSDTTTPQLILAQDLILTVGKLYRIEVTTSAWVSGSLKTDSFSSTLILSSGVGTTVFYGYASSSTLGITRNTTNVDVTLDSVSVKEITGTTGMPTTYTRNVGGVYPPRFDYDPVTLAPRGLLIEEQRTNLLTYSEAFDNAAWAKAAATVAANATTSPDGTTNADKLQEDNTTAAHILSATPTMAPSTTYTLSCYLKAAERSFGVLNIYTGTASCWTWYDLSTGVVSTLGSGATATITAVGNGWYRCTLTIATAATGSPNVAIFTAATNNVLSYTGTTGSGIYLWGAQLEAGAFATSYIPTVASQVTRTADLAAITAPMFASWYNQSAGTFVVEAVATAFPTGTSNNAIVTVSDGTNNNRQSLYSFNNVTYGATVNGTVVQANPTSGSGLTAGNVYKMAYAYATNDFALSTNGAAVGTDTSGTVPTVNQMQLGRQITYDQLNGWIRSVRFYPVRLTNAQLQALTA